MVLVLDAGHDPVTASGDTAKSGALGTCGAPEVVYNDQVLKSVAAAMPADGPYQVIQTRRFGESVDWELFPESVLLQNLSRAGQANWATAKTLYARAAIANAAHCDALVSFHHDATREDRAVYDASLCQDPVTGFAKGGKRLSEDFLRRYRVGYSVFVYNKDDANPARSAESRHLARLITRRIRALGRPPSNHHLPQEDCRSCEILDGQTGVYHQNLALLREAKCPAVLIEVGNIVDANDEAIVNNDPFRERLAFAVKAGVDDYFSLLAKRSARNKRK